MKKILILGGGLALAVSLLVVHLREPAAQPAPALNSETAEFEPSESGGRKEIPGQDSPDFVRSPFAPLSVAQTKHSEPVSTTQDRDQLLRDLRDWASRDVEGALARVMELPAGEARNEALEAVCFGLAQSDPAEGVELAQRCHLDERPGAGMENLVQQWASADLPAASDWVNGQPVGEPREQLIARIAFVRSKVEPAEAARLVVEEISPGPTQTEAAIMVLYQWANQDLAAAASWVGRFPEGPIRDRATAELAGIARYRQALMHSD